MKNEHLLLIPTAFMFLIIVSSSAFAEIEWTDNCTAGYHWRNATYCVSGSCASITQPPIYCPQGRCATNGLTCDTAANVPSEFIIFASIAMLFTAAICFFVGQKVGESVDEENTAGGYLGFAFFGVGLLLIIVALGALASFFSATPNSITSVFGMGQTMFITLLVIIVAIFLINYLIHFVKQSNHRKGKR